MSTGRAVKSPLVSHRAPLQHRLDAIHELPFDRTVVCVQPLLIRVGVTDVRQGTCQFSEGVQRVGRLAGPGFGLDEQFGWCRGVVVEQGGTEPPLHLCPFQAVPVPATVLTNQRQGGLVPGKGSAGKGQPEACFCVRDVARQPFDDLRQPSPTAGRMV